MVYKQDTHIVQHNAYKYVERNAEEIHDGASSLLRNILRPHLHDRWPENTYTGLKCAKANKLDATRKGDASTFLSGRHYQELFQNHG
jgi:hypothetical protein